jgi:hypothetical protein
MNIIEGCQTNSHQENGDDTNPVTTETLNKEVAETAKKEQACAVYSHRNAYLQHIKMLGLYQPHRQYGNQHIYGCRQQERCR